MFFHLKLVDGPNSCSNDKYFSLFFFFFGILWMILFYFCILCMTYFLKEGEGLEDLRWNQMFIARCAVNVFLCSFSVGKNTPLTKYICHNVRVSSIIFYGKWLRKSKWNQHSGVERVHWSKRKLIYLQLPNYSSDTSP